jgi:hypothetical protein
MMYALMTQTGCGKPKVLTSVHWPGAYQKRW